VFPRPARSFTSPNPSDLTTFDDVLKTFFRHLSWMCARQADAQLGGFSRMSAVCPSPLLSCFVDDCIEKGLDYYAGGAQFNVIGPCFIAWRTPSTRCTREAPRV
jgi:pyruvate-formate lyase